MIGAIAGDIIGSVYEHAPIKSKEFALFQPESRFTDDSVLSIAIAAAILAGPTAADPDASPTEPPAADAAKVGPGAPEAVPEGVKVPHLTGPVESPALPYQEMLREYGRRYPDAGYGGRFKQWLAAAEPQPYQSWGNGSAMRVSPVGLAFDSAEEVLHQALMSAIVTHDDPEGIRGAEATALALFLARIGTDKASLRSCMQDRFGYDLTGSVESLRPGYGFDVSCQGTVPAALLAFLDSESYEDAIRNAVSLGGDSDTLACIAGSIAEAFYGEVPAAIREEVEARLTPDLWAIVNTFCASYPVHRERGE